MQTKSKKLKIGYQILCKHTISVWEPTPMLQGHRVPICYFYLWTNISSEIVFFCVQIYN